MEALTIGSTVTVPFPFTDLKNSKIRPAIVLAMHGNSDFILCAVTSQNHSNLPIITLEKDDFSQGSLTKNKSFALCSKIFTADRSIIKPIAQLNKDKTSEILEAVRKLF